MKKRFLNIGLLLTMSLAVVNFVSCNRNEPDEPNNPNVIKAENVTGNPSGVRTVKAGLWDYDPQTWEGTFEVIAQAPFMNNGFTLNLPENLADRFLELVTEDAPGSITISDENAKWSVGGLRFYAFNSAGEEIGSFEFGNRDNNDKVYYVNWIYTDRNVTITGRYSTLEFNMRLRTGWNMMYDFYDEVNRIGSRITQRPAGVEFQWYFISHQ